MKRRCCLLLCCVLLTQGCDLWQKGDPLGRSRASAESRRGASFREGEPDRPAAKGSLWVSAVSYPDGYDWQRDTAYGAVDARLVLFKDGEPAVTVRTGASYHVSTDPDMHRIAGGHLYTDYSSANETWVGRDGKILFHYAGREMMAGFLAREDGIWTLGLDRTDGKGISLRRDGQVVFSDPGGSLPPGADNPAFAGGLLHEAGGSLYFFYYQDLEQAGTVRRTWFRVRDGTAEPLSLAQGVGAVWDIRQLGSQTVIIAQVQSRGLPVVVFQDGDSMAWPTDGASGIKDVRIAWTDGQLFYLKGILTSGRTSRSVFWNPSGQLQGMAWGAPVLDGVAEEDHFAWLLADSNGRLDRCIFDGQELPLGAACRYISPRCAQIRNGILSLALTPADRRIAPFILHDGQRQEFPLNGFLTGLTLE